MRCKICQMSAIAIFFAFSVAVCLGAENDAAPSVFFPETRYEFPPVLEDAKVVHDFVIQNKGNATLNVERVKTG
ncbi:MAG: hypothetical protein JRF47_11865 [Deltaproteobacteria bacterium]|nr:hypothetical protein [Deltaproteobacteria bacterium]MBW2656467.1 hypothetical protein [Deltaproteobacteria bacterium]